MLHHGTVGLILFNVFNFSFIHDFKFALQFADPFNDLNHTGVCVEKHKQTVDGEVSDYCEYNDILLSVA